MATSILSAGVSPAWLTTAPSKGYEIGPRNEPSAIKASAQKLLADLRDNFHDTTFETVFLSPGDTEDWEKFVTTLKSRKWDGVSIGGGARTIPELGDYFTELVHLVVKEQPGAVLMFPLLPENVGDAIRKYVPQAK